PRRANITPQMATSGKSRDRRKGGCDTGYDAAGQSSPFSDVPRCGGLAGRVHHNARLQRGLFCRWCEAPEIHVRCRGKIGEGRPHCDRLVELLRIDLVERVVCGVMVSK